MKTEKKQLTDRVEILKTLGTILEPWLDDTDLASLSEQTNLIGDFGLDSVAILQLVLETEKQFTITIKDHELDSEVFSKMANLINIIEGKLNETD